MAYAEVHGERIIVQTVWNEKERIKSIPGSSWDKDARIWSVPLTWVACLQLRGVFGAGLTLGDGLRTWAADERSRRVDPALHLRDLTAPEHDRDVSTIGRAFNPNLYDFQRAGVDFALTAGSFLLGDDMGTGKTIQLLETKRQLGDECLPALVVCPNSVKRNWRYEAKGWHGGLNPYVMEGGVATRRALLAQAAADPRALVIVNFEGLRAHSRLAPYGSTRLARCPDCGGDDPNVTATRCEVHLRELNLISFKTVIVDEAHRIKDPHSKQTRACWAVGHNASVTTRIAATGTPIAKDPSDLWSILHFLEPDEHPTKTKFIDRYCLVTWGTYGGLDVVGVKPETRDEFYRVLDPRYRRMPKDLVLPQLPPKVRQRRLIELSPKQLKAYREIEKDLITRLPDGTVMIAKDNLTARTRLMQFSSASMMSTPNGFRMTDPSPKIDQLLEDLEAAAGRPLVACAEHRQLIDLASQRLTKLKIPHGLITGGQREWEREAHLREFQEGKLPILLFTIKAGGTGLTMTAADTIIYLQRSWSMIDNMQSEDRVHRIGSEGHSSINVIDYVAQGTVEEEQIIRLYDKARRLEEITRDRQRLAAAGVSTQHLDEEEAFIMALDLGILA